MTVADALSRWHELSIVLVRRQMACAGCAMVAFERLSDAAESYGTPSEMLLQELRAALRG